MKKATILQSLEALFMKITAYFKKYFWDGLAITVLVLVFSVFFLKFPYHIPKFDPLTKALKDFELSDIWFSKVHERDTILTNPYIRIVDVGTLDRGQIGELINKINRFNPKVIGVDIQFTGSKDPHKDSILSEAIQNSKHIVLAGSLKNMEDQSNSIFPLEGKSMGFINLNVSHNTNVRSFFPVEKINGKDQFAFAALIAKAFDEDAFDHLLDRKVKEEVINYSGNKEHFSLLTPDKIDSSEVAGNIVLIGFCCSNCKAPVLEDLHFTPLNPEYSGKSFPDMYGVVIHANIIAMILTRQYIDDAPFWLILILALLSVFLYIQIVIPWFVQESKHKWFHIVAKLSQLGLTIAFLFFEFFLLGVARYKLDMGLMILAIALSIDFIYFYEFFIRLFKIKGSVFF
ncbi:MAG: CHASE2 domain-containing protein [Bacteroidales bacterium]